MRQKIVPGAELEVLTPLEAVELLEHLYREEVEYRVRGAATIALDATGAGQDEVYNPPLGMEFEARRVSIDLASATDPFTGAVLLNAAGKTIEYLRSGTRIEWGQPSYGAAIQVPGVQTWGDEQGPYIRNGEVFEVRARGLTANGSLDVTVEGILRRPPSEGQPAHRSADKTGTRTHPRRTPHPARPAERALT